MFPGPRVRLLAAFPLPLDTAVAAARTCTSAHGPVVPDDVLAAAAASEAGWDRARRKRDTLARSLYAAGHHTTFQHAHFMFLIDGVSRQLVWSFLHAHPFSNSEQVSQRYVPVGPGAVAVPEMPTASMVAYSACVRDQHAAYRRLVELLTPVAEGELLRRVPGLRRHPDRLARGAERKAQEVARAVLPVATLTGLYHTVSCLTLFRYRRLCLQHDVPAETRALVDAMVAEVLDHDPDLATVLEEPIPLEETPEHRIFTEALAGETQPAAFRAEFDAALGVRSSRLIAPQPGNVARVAAAVRAVFGLTRDRLADDDAVALALDPARNRLLGEDLNLTSVSKLGRCLQHAHYTFAKRLSHAADSQDQRHRMTPGARPLLAAVVDGEPDVITPRLVRYAGGEAEVVFRRAVERAWQGASQVRATGAAHEAALYLLPNALAVRFVESSDLANLHHKHRMRLCYNAQEEIWQASLDEATEITEIEPAIGRWLLPPCAVRQAAGRRPFCPEGDRYCGIAVWRLPRDQYSRVI